jgi:DNA-binding CsgD family transcriptional regulator
VSPTGEVLWQTPEVQNLLSAHSAAWLNAVFYPSLTHWVTHPDAPRLLRLQTEKSAFLQLEWLAGSYLNPYTEILVRLHNDDNKQHEQQLVTAFALSAREAEVLLWLSRGKTNKEIAHILAISARTINKHLEQVFKKVGVDNRTQAAAQALAQLRQ